ncbi:MAG: CAP domain-containing protein [Candidatus Falkowbacteria bacterium]
MGIFLLPKVAWLSSITEENIIRLTNGERTKNNLEILTANELLAKAAYRKGEDIMASGRFQHNFGDRSFSAWIKEAGYNYTFAGENLAIDFVTSEGALKAWLASPTHQKNILNEKFTETGVAVINGNFQGNDATLVVQIFGAPLLISSVSGSVAEGRQILEEPTPTPLPSVRRDNGFKTLYSDYANPLKLVISMLSFAVFLIFMGVLGRSANVQNFFTAKNKQLRLPLK